MSFARVGLLLSVLGLAACAAAPGGAGPAPAITAASLQGTRWVGVVAESVDRRQVPRLEFVREGRLSGFTGCNLISGSWSVEGGVFKLGPVATTKRFCVGPEMEIEKRVLAAMGEGAKLTREGGKLVMVGTGGARFEFTEAPPGY